MRSDEERFIFSILIKSFELKDLGKSLGIEFLSPNAILLISVSFNLFNNSSGLSRTIKESTGHAFPSASGFSYN